MSHSTVLSAFKNAHQDHVLAFYEDLSDSEKSSLLSQLSSFDVDRVNRIFKVATSAPAASAASKSDGNAGAGAVSPVLAPLPPSSFDSVVGADQDTLDKVKLWRSKGLELISEGKVAVILLAVIHSLIIAYSVYAHVYITHTHIYAHLHAHTCIYIFIYISNI